MPYFYCSPSNKNKIKNKDKCLQRRKRRKVKQKRKTHKKGLILICLSTYLSVQFWWLMEASPFRLASGPDLKKWKKIAEDSGIKWQKKIVRKK